MTIHDVFQQFINLDLSTTTIRINKDVKSIWVSTNEKSINDKIHIRLTDDYTIMRLYVNRDGMDYKITYIEESDDIYFHAMKSRGENFTENVIHGVMALKSEEEFFQHSLINDTLDLEYNDCLQMQLLFSRMVVLAYENFK